MPMSALRPRTASSFAASISQRTQPTIEVRLALARRDGFRRHACAALARFVGAVNAALDAAGEYQKLAGKHGVPLAGIALAFVMKRFFVAATIIGATSVKQLEEMEKYFSLALSAEVLAGIEAINNQYPSPCAQ